MPAKEKIPEQFLKSLEELFQKTEFVETAFFTQVLVRSSGEPPHPFIAVKVDKDFDKLNFEIGKIVKGTFGSNQFIDIVPMSDFYAEWMTTPHVRIFYRRNSSH